MSNEAGEQAVLNLFDTLSNMDITPIETLSADPQAAVAEAREAFTTLCRDAPSSQ